MAAIKYSLKKRIAGLTKRPIIGHDFTRMRFVYNDLFNHNSETYKLAGRPDFPVNSDTYYPTTAEAFDELCRKLETEVLLKMAYSRITRRVDACSQAFLAHTNRWQRLPLLGGQIAKIILKPLSSQAIEDMRLSLSDDPQKLEGEVKSAEKLLRLFEQFLSLRRNGVNPLGRILRIPFDEFTNVYGYGQCYNQSYALADLFSRNGIAVRLIHIHRPRHVLVEAEFERGRWAAFDPLLSRAFLDPINSAALSFAQVRAHLEWALKRFPVENVEEAKAYYQAEAVTVETFRDSNIPASTPRFKLEPGQRVEYLFAESYPWITLRNLTPPPEGVLGHYKHFWGEGTEFRVTTPYPIVEAEVFIPTGEAKISVEGVQVAYQPGWNRVRLARYLNYNRELHVTSSRPIQLTTISQLSALRYNCGVDGFLRVDAARDTPVEVTVSCTSVESPRGSGRISVDKG